MISGVSHMLVLVLVLLCTLSGCSIPCGSPQDHTALVPVFHLLDIDRDGDTLVNATA